LDTTRALNELDPPDWGGPPPDATGLIANCHAARQKPLNTLTGKDLRILIGQNIGLPYLVPLAMESCGPTRFLKPTRTRATYCRQS
jgi:hypothetical protein